MRALFLTGVATLGFSLLAEQSAASPVTFVFSTLVDATQVGFSSAEPVSLTYSFDPAAAPFQSSPGFASYRILGAQLSFHGDTESVDTNNVNDRITVINNNLSGKDSYVVNINDHVSVAGYHLVVLGINLTDADGSTFSSTALPTDPTILYNLSHLQFSIDLEDNNDSPYSLTPPNGYARFQVNLVEVSEPASLALLGMSVVGIAAARRRRAMAAQS